MLLSIQGMYEYDPDIMSGFRVPEGVNRTDAINDIMLKCAELEIIYPDFEIMKTAITTWCNSEFKIWQKLYNSTDLEYNPIWNVDANITITDQGTQEDNRTITDSGTRENDMTGSSTKADTISLSSTRTDEISSSNTETNSVKGFNETAWAEHEKVTNTGSSTENETISNTQNNNETASNTQNTDETFSNTRNDGYNSEKTGTRTERRTGNIGVTATQDLIKKEREIADFNIINYITQSFKERFCLLIY